MSEDDPDLSWLDLVSAVETAATRADQSIGSATDGLREGIPGLIPLLEENGGQDLVDAVAPHLAYLTRSLTKFRKFVLDRSPDPRQPRPTIGAMSWNPSDMKDALGTIYNRRSKRLHEAIPFPAPMCMAPLVDSSGVHAETPMAPTAYAGSMWTLKDAPMLLHTFEYIVGEALRAWWLDLPTTS
jgi:hypothetical protein